MIAVAGNANMRYPPLSPGQRVCFRVDTPVDDKNPLRAGTGEAARETHAGFQA
jgi:hypothetical protein